MNKVLRTAPGLASCLLFAACSVSVPAPDLNLPDGGGEDVTVADVPAEAPDPGTQDPGAKDEAPVDPGKDPAADPGKDLPTDPIVTDPIVVAPQNGGHPCTRNEECVSGMCAGTFCTCRDVADCDEGMWCDTGDTKFSNTMNCLWPRQNFTGCMNAVHCKSGACNMDNRAYTNGRGYCANCATAKDCENTPDTPMCCGGNCAAGCMGCAVAPPPAPEYQFCASGCWDPETQYCGPDGPTAKLGAGADCRFLDSWCLSRSCLIEPDGTSSLCACDDSIAPCQDGLACVEGRCLGIM